MILTGSAIKQAVKRHAITITPFKTELVNPNSYNFRLGADIYEVTEEFIDPHQTPKTNKLELENDGSVLLSPGKLYLGSTFEAIGSEEYVTSLGGRSSIGRLGLFLQITADLGQLGDAHSWTLELKVVKPLKLYAGMPIGQVSFWTTKGKKNTYYRKRYTNYNEPATFVGRKI
jgi:dCTP deaminase